VKDAAEAIFVWSKERQVSLKRYFCPFLVVTTLLDAQNC